MPDKNEKERRKKIMAELAEKSNAEFEGGLPMERDIFKTLFDYLDEKLGDESCDNTLKITKHFLLINNITKTEIITEWLQNNGGGCDCEVLANVEELFEN